MLLAIILILPAFAALGICLGCEAFAGLSWLWVLPVSYLGSLLAECAVCFAFVYMRFFSLRLQNDSGSALIGILKRGSGRIPEYR